ncbi:flavin-containing monooxygenase [Aspergillus lucknowensis]|uniref:FAD/NAD(P)-binding domain-containing protein n=1 Tax=Aspergillus lucknowensis TaxID=176173 RepID=A0ABR4LZI2_9EURO
MASHSVDLLIVGAGLHGLIMAKTYLEVHPSAALLVVDESHSVGGTWARERLYPGLKTNNVFGSYELSDFPMVPERYGVQGTGHIPGHVVHAYLCDVVDHFEITPHLMLSTKVTSATLLDGGLWSVTLKPVHESLKPVQVIQAARLVIATGLTSTPHIPQIPGSETFDRFILHSKQLREQAQKLEQSKAVVVVGGNKSAWDVCYTAARAGSQVHMVVRQDGGGPSYLWPRQFSLGQFTVSLAKLSTTRLFALFDPAPFSSGPFSWQKRFLHQTYFGQMICQMFWTYLDKLIRKLNGYNTHPELQKLEPWATPFWMGNSLSIHNYETSWFDLVREGKIHIHIADLESLSPGKVHLADGTALEADALVLCTGWTTDIPVKLAVEHDIAKEEKMAMETIHASIPYLSQLPKRTPNVPRYRDKSTSPSQVKGPAFPLLYRDIIPVEEFFLRSKNLAFIGMSVSIHAVLIAQAQALWITAFFSDKVGHLPQETFDAERVRNRAILGRVYGQLRRPRETGGLAGRHADLVFDSLPYVDELLDDVGVTPARKGSWWCELTEAYRVSDYRGIVQEWMRLWEIDSLKVEGLRS